MRTITRYLAQQTLGFAALIVALGGTAYAASQISSGDIANNSIRSKDIKDSAVKSPDIGSFRESFSIQPHTTTVDVLPNVTYEIDAGCAPNGQSGGALTVTTLVSSPDLEVLGVYPVDANNEPLNSPSDEMTNWVVKAQWNGPAGPAESLTTFALCAD